MVPSPGTGSADADEPPDRNAMAAARAARDFAQLQAQVEQARAELARLQDAVRVAEHRLDSAHEAHRLEAVEQLLSSALRAQQEAEAAEQALEEVSRSAELDALTQLPNRLLLLDRLGHAIVNANRHGARLALLFVDLDDFKQINDSLGHAVGDDVLKQAAHCLTSSVREADTVSRHGGDEFLILLDEVADASDAVRVADKVIAALGVPLRVDDEVLRLKASIGISIFPDDGVDADTLIDRADAAMYLAKRRGVGSFVVHGKQAPTSELGLESSPPRPPSAAPPPSQADHEWALAEHERRHAQLREANEQLVLAALGAQDLKTAAELAQRRQTEFLSVVAHELRNPLAPISNAAALLGMLPTDELLPRLQSIIERQVAHMSRLVGDLLDVSRVSSGKLRIEPRLIDMTRILEQAAEAGRPAMDARGQHFSVQLPGGVLEVHGDPIRLAQVASNLLDNASKYTPVGGRIALSAVVVDAAIVISVSDSGIGITAEALPHVFEPFVQDTHAIGFNGAGLGIGLTVVRELVEAHGGTVVATSAGTGQGSEFVVTLPLAVAAMD